jgi:hypothetical protein
MLARGGIDRGLEFVDIREGDARFHAWLEPECGDGFGDVARATSGSSGDGVILATARCRRSAFNHNFFTARLNRHGWFVMAMASR